MQSAEEIAKVNQLRAEIARLEDLLGAADEKIMDLEGELLAFQNESPDPYDPLELLHDGIRELGFDLGAEDVPYNVTTTAHQMRLAAALQRAGHATE